MKKETTKQVKVKVTKANAKAHYAALGRQIGAGKLPATTGEFIRARLVQGKGRDEILAEVKKKFKGSTAKASDVYWNRGRLKKEGIKLAS